MADRWLVLAVFGILTAMLYLGWVIDKARKRAG